MPLRPSTLMQKMPSTPDEEPGETRPSVDVGSIEEWALAYLGRYASSAANLRRVLLRRVRRRSGPGTGVAPAVAGLVDALVARYVAAGLIDDAAYAAGRARRDLGRGRSLRRITAALAAKGVGAEDAAAATVALREIAADPDLAAACAFARRRRLGPYRREPAEAADRRRELGAFARAGFSRQEAERVLACTDEAAIAALLTAD
jgi:regulatory protein